MENLLSNKCLNLTVWVLPALVTVNEQPEDRHQSGSMMKRCCIHSTGAIVMLMKGSGPQKNNFTESLCDLPFIWRTLIMYQQIITTDCKVIRETVSFRKCVAFTYLMSVLQHYLNISKCFYKKLAFRNTAKYWLVNSYQRFGGCYASITSETLLTNYQYRRHYVSEETQHCLVVPVS